MSGGAIGAVCPRCASSNVQRRSRRSGVLAAAAVFAVLALARYVFRHDDIFALVLNLACMFSFAAILAAAFSAAFGKDRCRECRHRWRTASEASGTGSDERA